MNNSVPVYTIVPTDAGEYMIHAEGQPLTKRGGGIRFYSTRSSARKAVSRLRRGVTQ